MTGPRSRDPRRDAGSPDAGRFAALGAPGASASPRRSRSTSRGETVIRIHEGLKAHRAFVVGGPREVTEALRVTAPDPPATGARARRSATHLDHDSRSPRNVHANLNDDRRHKTFKSPARTAPSPLLFRGPLHLSVQETTLVHRSSPRASLVRSSTALGRLDPLDPSTRGQIT